MNDYGSLVGAGAVRFERLLPGPIDRLWDYLTDPDKRSRWFAGGPMELAVGGDVELVFRNSQFAPDDDPPPPKYAAYAVEGRMRGRVVACEPPRVLAYTVREAAGEESEVRFELTPRGKDVLLVLTHRRIATRDALLGFSGGWHVHLSMLRARLLGEPLDGFWRTHTRLEAEYARRFPPH